MPSGLFTLKQVNQSLAIGGWSNQKTPSVDYLVVAGGGGSGYDWGAPGGAGGLVQGTVAVASGSSITVTVGAGGNGRTQGSNSVFGNLIATGGGRGGSGGSGGSNPGGNGGSGGGGTTSANGANGVAGVNVYNQGLPGSYGYPSSSAGDNGTGGGGGAGSVAEQPAAGYGTLAGSGIAVDISGTRTAYAGGGNGNGASVNVSVTTAARTSQSTNGAANSGSGGGGGDDKVGGSGVVILSYPDIYAAATSTTGSPTVSTSGAGSIKFNGSSDYFYYSAQSAFAFGTGDFTIEGWFYYDSVSGVQILYDFRPASVNSDAPCVYSSGGVLYYYPAGTNRITGTTTLSTGTWYHIALCRSGTSTRLFLNGVQEGSTYTDTLNYVVGTNRPMIGSNGFGSGGSSWFNGRMSNLRMLKGTALYTSSFTVPSAPLQAISNTSLLLGAVSGAYLSDTSGNGYSAIAVGSPSWNSSSPFATGLGYKNRVYTWTSSGSITF